MTLLVLLGNCLSIGESKKDLFYLKDRKVSRVLFFNYFQQKRYHKRVSEKKEKKSEFTNFSGTSLNCFL